MSFDVRNQHVVVAGGGRSGLAAADLLVSKGARVTLSDLREPEGAAALRERGVTVDVGPHRAEMFASANLIVLSPGVPPEQPAVAAARRAGVPVMGEIELASRWLSGRVVAITGTKGKSTTTTLTARMLREGGFDATAGGNLGVALSAQVRTSHPAALHVVEVSSFQLETTTTFHPWIAVLLNLSPDHLDRHPSFEAYAGAKARVFANQTATDWAVVNADDEPSMKLAAQGRAQRFDFALDAGVSRGVTVREQEIVRRDAGQTSALLPVSAVRLPGRHLLGDVLAASAVACIAGVEPAAMRRAVEGFTGLPHALERVGEINGIAFVNDSKATNIASAGRALESFPRGIVAIMGGRFKGGDFRDLIDVVRNHGTAIIAIGEAAPLIDQALGSIVPVTRAASMGDAVRAAFERAEPGGVVLLAPACSSFDMFRDYVDRGDQFRDAVHALARTFDSHQTGRGGEEPAAGNAGRSGL
jgi:UDP-N-acetylmuramoylalanine--D-glutamate ligase